MAWWSVGLAALVLGAPAADDGVRLRDLARARGVEIGANLPYRVDGPAPNNWDSSPIIARELAMAERHFGILSAGWQMYPGHVWRTPDRHDFAGADRFVAWCAARGIRVHGHGLAYLIRLDWLNRMPAGNEVERADLRRLVEDHVTRIAGHFRGRVHLWDVANEQLRPAYAWRGFLDDRPYWRAFQTDPARRETGVEWYRRVFRLAHQADPAAQLVLLEFNNEVESPKSDTLYDLVKRLRTEGIPVHGVGFQMHLGTDLNRSKGHGLPDDDAYFASFARNLRRFGELGVGLWITELDVTIDESKPREAELRRQAEVYGRVVRTALAEPAVRGIKFWGILDANPWGTPVKGSPNLWDAAGRPKPAFHAVADALAAR